MMDTANILYFVRVYDMYMHNVTLRTCAVHHS